MSSLGSLNERRQAQLDLFEEQERYQQRQQAIQSKAALAGVGREAGELLNGSGDSFRLVNTLHKHMDSPGFPAAVRLLYATEQRKINTSLGLIDADAEKKLAGIRLLDETGIAASADTLKIAHAAMGDREERFLEVYREAARTPGVKDRITTLALKLRDNRTNIGILFDTLELARQEGILGKTVGIVESYEERGRTVFPARLLGRLIELKLPCDENTIKLRPEMLGRINPATAKTTYDRIKLYNALIEEYGIREYVTGTDMDAPAKRIELEHALTLREHLEHPNIISGKVKEWIPPLKRIRPPEDEETLDRWLSAHARFSRQDLDKMPSEKRRESWIRMRDSLRETEGRMF